MLENTQKLIDKLGCWSLIVDPMADGTYIASIADHDDVSYVYDSHSAQARTISDALYMLDAMCAETLHCLEIGTLLLQSPKS